MRGPGLFDGALQMFVEEPREPDVRWLEFLRWLVENGGLVPAMDGISPGRSLSGLGEPTINVPDPELDGRLAASGHRGR
jgi:hypothetical protein